MSKKAKIITSAICIGLVVLGLAITIILVAIKRFNITPNDTVTLNNHTQMIECGYDEFEYSAVSATISNNATKIIKNNQDKVGVYSYIDRDFVIPTTHDSITLVEKNIADGHAYYKTVDNGESHNIINLLEEHGRDIGVVNYSKNSESNTAYIKEKSVNIVSSAGSVKATAKNKFVLKEVHVQNAELLQVYYDVDKYWYETWDITTTDDMHYTNLYKIKRGQHELIQTINNDIGLKPEEKDLQLFFTKNGTPRLVNLQNTGTHSTYNKFVVYDINYHKLGTAEINDIQAENINKYFQIGDKFFVQCLVPTDSKKYDLQTTVADKSYYYNVDTYKINLKTGDISKAKFKYVVVETNTDFNNETALLKLVKIKGKRADVESYYVVNDRLQTQAIDYKFDSITKISKNHYIATSATGDITLIGNNYKKLADFSDYNEYFTTENAIVLKSATDTYAYVCNHNGDIIKKYLKTEIENTYSTKYYSVKETVIDGANTTTSYYLENLGIREKNPYRIIVNGNQAHTYNDIDYTFARTVFTEHLTLVLRIKESNGLYDYDFYNIEGKLMTSLTGYTSSGYAPTELYADKDHTVIIFESHCYTLDR